MITVLIICNKISNIEKMASGIMRGTGLTTCILSTTDPYEGLSILNNKQYRIDMFVIEVQMKTLSGYKLEDAIRKNRRYADTPILFITKENYNLVGFSHLATYENYKKRSYLSLPIDSIDAQGKIGLYLENILANQLKYDKERHIIHLRHTKGFSKIKTEQIHYIEVQNKQCTIHIAGQAFHVKRKTLSEMVDEIDNPQLLRCHRCFAVNVGQITSIEKVDKRNWAAHFGKSPDTCPVSKTYAQQILGKYKEERIGNEE